MRLLQELSSQRQWKSRAPGTWVNHRSAVSTFLAFCHRFGLHPVTIRHQMICVFVEYLNIYIPAPATISNSISHIRVFMRLTGYPNAQLEHPRVARALEALHRNKGYVPKTKAPVPMGVLRQVLTSMDGSPPHVLAKAALLIQFYAALRKSEVTPPSKNKFDAMCHPTRGDLKVIDGRLSLCIKAAKNMQRTEQRRTVTLEPSENKVLCVVTAVQEAIALAPTLHRTDPLLMFPADRAPVPVSLVQKVWGEQLVKMGLQKSTFSLHCLRNSAATEAHEAGVPEMDIQNYGGWRSTAHRKYIKRTDSTRVNKSLIKSLQHKDK